MTISPLCGERQFPPVGLRHVWLVAWTLCFATATVHADDAAVERYLHARLSSNPDDAATWRMWGRWLLERRRIGEAERALRRAAQLDPANAAARFDLGQLLWNAGRTAEGVRHLQAAVEIAPDSEYAATARRMLDAAPAEADAGDVQTAGYDVRNFDGSEEVRKYDATRQRLFASDRESLWMRVETGVVHNGNVALSPLSRELSPGDTSTGQLFAAPELEWAAFETGVWRGGPLLAGHFTLNEGEFRQFNLQSFRPGVFAEHSAPLNGGVLVRRVQYEFTFDMFDGTTFGRRHAVTSSAALLWPNRDVTLVYWTVDRTDFADDGVLRSVTAGDGWTNTAGLSHDLAFDRRWLKLLRSGVELQRADTQGSDFRYNGISVYTEVRIPVCERTLLSLTGSWGYRDYFDFEFTPSRDEHVWRGGARLERKLTEQLSIAGVVSYDRFDSANPLFEAERLIAGGMFVFQR